MMTSKIRTLIVDDSATMRALLAKLLSAEPDIEVVGTATDALHARGLIKELNPDVITLDIEMPGMSGLEFLEKLMRLRPTPVIIVSSLTRSGTDTTAQALQMGAVDCVPKPSSGGAEPLASYGAKLADLIRAAAQVNTRSHSQVVAATPPVAHVVRSGEARLIAIGSSTGGVEALQVLLAGFPANCPPTVVVQHINGAFAEAVARRLDASCPPKICLAEPDTALRPGHVYLAPGNERHLQVRGEGTFFSKMRASDPVSGHRPSVDMLFHSVAQAVGKHAVGIQLTGMGSDGAQGLLAMRQAGAYTIAQDEATCTVFGMPRAAIALGAAAEIAGIHQIAQRAFAKAA
ncbi:MAG: chemotaxis response regulator protein-glutamate methylesterase [Sphingomonas sp.]